MNIAAQHNIASRVAVVTSVLPESSAAATVNGSSIDRQAHNNSLSCVLHQVAGAISGAPSASSIVSKIQDSADNSTFADYLPDGVNVAQSAALTAQNTENSTAVDLGSARRYIRVVTTVGFTGGTSPAALVAADLVLGGQDTLPAV